MFIRSTEDEVKESLQKDCVLGLFEPAATDAAKPVALCICVMNRDSERNITELASKESKLTGIKWENSYTVDSIQVSPPARGKGYQQMLLRTVEHFARQNNIRYLLATVSPDNAYSKNNLEHCGFQLAKATEIQEGTYNGNRRHVATKCLTEASV